MFLKNFSLRFWIFGTIFTIGILGLSLVSALWLLYEKSFQDQYDADTLSFRMQNAVTRISYIIGNQTLILNQVSHSLSLRRHIIKINQEGLRNSPVNIMNSIADTDKHWKHIQPNSPEVDAICGSLEARYLRDTMALSGGIIDRIDVTDAFGAVRVATSRPSRFFVGNTSWWRTAFLANPNLIHMEPNVEKTENGLFWNLSAPLRNDDGTDAVGIVRTRLRMDLIIDQATASLRKYGINIYVQVSGSIVFPPQAKPEIFPASMLSQVPIGRKQVMLDTTHKVLVTGIAMQSILPKSILPLNWMLYATQKYQPKIVFTNPVVLKTSLIWVIGVLFWFTISYLIARWITVPLSFLSRGVRQIADGDFKYRIPQLGISDLGTLSSAFNEMARQLDESKTRIKRFVENQTQTLNALKLYIQNLLSTDHISSVQETLLHILLKMMDADAGILIVQDETGARRSVSTGLSMEVVNRLILYLQSTHVEKNIYMAWRHTQLNHIWRLGFQVILYLPITTGKQLLGAIVLLYMKATERDLDKQDVPDLLSTLTAFHLTFSRLNSELSLQKRITNTVLSGLDIPIFIVNETLQLEWLSMKTLQHSGCADDDCIGKFCYRVFYRRNEPCSECPVLQTFRTGNTHSSRQPWLTGSPVQKAQITSHPVKNEYGALIKAIVIVQIG